MGEGARVTLLERRGFLGGRAYSYAHPALEEEVDSQHVMLGCCTNLIDLCGRRGSAERFAGTTSRRFWSRVGDGACCGLRGCRRRCTRREFSAGADVELADKAGIAAGLAEFMRGVPADDSESLAAWLKRTGQTERAIRHFWEPVVLGALNDTFERCSTEVCGRRCFMSRS